MLFITATVFFRSFDGESLPTQIYLEKATISPPRPQQQGKKLASKFIYWVTYLARNLLAFPTWNACVFGLNLCVFWLPTFTWLSTHSPGNCIKFQLINMCLGCGGVHLKSIWFMKLIIFITSRVQFAEWLNINFMICYQTFCFQIKSIIHHLTNHYHTKLI